jgi:hypothetical protein
MIMQQPTSGPVPVSRIRPFTGWDREFNAAILHIADKLTNGRYTGVTNAPSTLQELKDRFAYSGQICVSSEHCDNTIYGDREVNIAFRAWHDWCHLVGNHEFDLGGEYTVAKMQYEHMERVYGKRLARKWWPLIDAEVSGQAAYVANMGEFPVDQPAFDKLFIRKYHPSSVYAA